MVQKKEITVQRRLGQQMPFAKLQKLNSTGKDQPKPRIKCSIKMQKEEQQGIHKFKTRPINKKILAGGAALGIPKPVKLQVTKPEEFHFRTDKRACRHHHDLPSEQMKELSLDSESHHHTVNAPTSPKPFHLLTDERGAAKQRKIMRQLQEQKKKEQELRIPKANLLPYTTVYPVIPQRAEGKKSTKPEPFQLESTARHERKMQHMMDKRAEAEREEAQMRKFRAEANKTKRNVAVHIPRVPVAPVTEVQEFNFRSDARAVERLEFEKKLLEKEMMYKKFKEERAAASKAEEERVVKEMRKAMVPHARPMPVFDRPFVPQKSSKEPTGPKPPKFQRWKERPLILFE